MAEDPSNAPPPFNVPSVEEMEALLPQYAFEKLAAFGGMGAVYRARQRSLDRPVAIKILPPEFGVEPEFAERFKSEARAMAKMNQTNIVAVYDFGQTRGGHLYLVMEWVEGPTLHEIIHKGSVPAQRAADLGMQLCDALTYAHNHKILHRDIKPGNIMVNQEGQVKVADFGLARPMTGEAEENPYGTPDYAAPEILNRGTVDQRVDIFAAGIVLYEMLTGRVPKTPRRPVTEYAPVSKRWDEVIGRAIHPDPEKRFQNAEELRIKLLSLVQPASEVLAVAVPVAEDVEGEQRSKFRPKPLHFVFGITALIIAWFVIAGMISPKPNTTEKPVKEQATKRSADQPGFKKAPDEMQQPEVKPLVEQSPPTPEPRPMKKRPIAEPPAKIMADAPTPSKPAKVAPVPEPAPAPENPRDAILQLEERDPELAQLVKAFAHEWAMNDAIDTGPEVEELAEKYIPALQRSLTGLSVEQRDEVLSEISHIANREPPAAPSPAWPPVLHSLRRAYDSQLDAILAAAKDASKRMREAQCELVRARAAARADAGSVDAAKRAEVVAEQLNRLEGAPSLKALKDAVRDVTTSSAIQTPASTSAPQR